MISLHFSYYWLLVPLAIILLIWIGRTDGGRGYGAGLAVVFVLFLAVVIFLAVLCLMLLFDVVTR